MGQFQNIYDRAAKRRGGATALDKLLPVSKSTADLEAMPNDRYLAGMTKCVFNAGFSWKVVEQKWDGFEEAFFGFEPRRIVALNDEDLDGLMHNTAIIRHGQKIRATRDNARFVLDLAEEHGSAGRFFATWPGDDIVELWALLKKRGSRLGGASGQYFLRFAGIDTPIMSRDVVAALIGEGIVDKTPTSQRDLKSVQAAFNEWRAESGRGLAEISRILAFSVG
ncbi:MAG: DNA-3-methyladenine glycosylase I [Alphaproteobacteria bacterium]|nr:DNA-3-methyladenine glycosylase I [Alphaproteobacteria bacterium]